MEKKGNEEVMRGRKRRGLEGGKEEDLREEKRREEEIREVVHGSVTVFLESVKYS